MPNENKPPISEPYLLKAYAMKGLSNTEQQINTNFQDSECIETYFKLQEKPYTFEPSERMQTRQA
jgi:hypothetical protein